MMFVIGASTFNFLKQQTKKLSDMMSIQIDTRQPAIIKKHSDLS